MSSLINVGSLLVGVILGTFLTAIMVEVLGELDKGPAEEDTRDWRTPCDLCKHGPPKNRRPCITCPAERDWHAK